MPLKWLKISGNICVQCTKTHSKGYIAFKKLFNFENNNCIYNRQNKIIFTFSTARLSTLSYQKGSAMQE